MWTKTDACKMAKLHNGGKTLEQVAKSFETSRRTVGRVMKAHGVAIRSKAMTKFKKR